MFYILCKIESLLLHTKVIIIKSYYKIKFGKRISFGKNIIFRNNFKIIISKNGYIEIGDNCFFNSGCTIDCNKKIVIGKHNLFGENIKIYDHNHVFNDKSIDRGVNYRNYNITIANENWFGTGVVILGNTTIGNNNVIGANTVLKGFFSNDTIIKNINSNDYDIRDIEYKGADR